MDTDLLANVYVFISDMELCRGEEPKEEEK